MLQININYTINNNIMLKMILYIKKSKHKHEKYAIIFNHNKALKSNYIKILMYKHDLSNTIKFPNKLLNSKVFKIQIYKPLTVQNKIVHWS